MNYNRDERDYAFKPITENPLVLDFSKCRYLGEVHLLLKERFGLPKYYGENWSALRDCLSDLFMDDETLHIEIHGYAEMDKHMEGYAATMLKIFHDMHEKYPNAVFKYIS